MSRTTFEWNKNSFCQLFRETKNAEQFISVWNKNTTFNKVTQCAEPVSSGDQLEVESDSAPSPTPPAKRRAENSSQEGCKKHCTSPLDENIEHKKIGKDVSTVHYIHV